MFKHWAMRLSIALSVLLAPAAQAFVDPPWITPAEPRAGEVVSVNTRMGICDVVIFRPGYPQITREGNAIRFLMYGHHYWEGDDRCYYPIGTGTEPIGAFSPGNYSLTVDMLYVDYFGEPQILKIGVIPFTVTGVVPAVPVSTLSPSGLVSLLLLVSVFAGWTLRTRRTACLLILLSAFVAQSAHAFIDPPWITPVAPRAGEIVSVNFHMGICDVITERPGYPQITRDGNAIRIIEYGNHYSEGDELCVYPIGMGAEPIGSFAPGDYVLTVDFLYTDVLGYTIMNLGVISFTVTDAESAAQVPASSPSFRFALLFLMSGYALWALRMLRRRSG